jgi:hypothetical protein
VSSPDSESCAQLAAGVEEGLLVSSLELRGPAPGARLVVTPLGAYEPALTAELGEELGPRIAIPKLYLPYSASLTVDIAGPAETPDPGPMPEGV